MNREQAADFVKDQLEAYLKRKGIDTGEPFVCLNPDHQDTDPSMIYDHALRKVHCFSCKANYDIFDLIGIDYHLTDPGDIFKKAYELYRIKLQKMEMERPGGKYIDIKAEEPPKDYTDYIKQAHERVGETDYFQKRGLSPATIERFLLGYEPAFTTKDSTGFRTWRAGIIPTSRFTYTVRNMDPHALKTERIRKRGGSSPIFNPQALQSGRPVFIVEGEMDALSLVEVGAEAAALASPANTEPFIQHIKKYPPAGGLILSLDNDQTGLETTAKLAQELKVLDIPFSQVNISEPYNDPNEALIADREAFAKAVQEALNALITQEEEEQEMGREEYRQTCAAYYLRDFQGAVADSVNTTFIPTGFNHLDDALDGGLYEGLYILTAVGSSGKTAFVMQAADRIAGSGHDVLVFSLETARTELMARSISRLTFQGSGANPGEAKTARGITTGSLYEGYSPDERQLITSSTEAYGQYADHIYINEGRGDVGAEQVRATIARHQRLTGNRPVVIVDCLQLLAPQDPRASDKYNLGKAVLELKRMSRDYRTTVLVIGRFNQPKAGDPGEMAGLEEYRSTADAADVILGLEAKGAGERDGLDMEAAKPGVPRQAQLTILKNRSGPAGQSIDFDYYPQFNCFIEGD
ncbi:MAG: DnaB-like helicase C-terminal domain-containing protein [Syntrophomonadaceae bacterium]